MARFIWDKNKKKAIPIEELQKQSSDSSQSTGESNFSDMTDEQLATYAAQKGIDISRLNTREKVIARLEKTEGTE